MASSRRASARPSGWVKSRVTSRLLVFAPWNRGASSHGRSPTDEYAVPMRVPSGRCTDSTFTTSAPRKPRICAAYGPAQYDVKSNTRRPASGRAASPVSPACGLARDARVRSFRAQRLGVGADRRHRAERAGRRATQAVRHAGLHHGPVGVLDEDLTFHERREPGQRLAIAQRRDRDPPFTRQVQHLVGGVRGRERGDLGPEHPVVLAPAVDPAELRMVGPFRVAHHLREGAELRRAVGREAHPAVGGRLDRRHVDEAADRLRLRPAAVELRRHRLELVERDRHRLERRHVDERARARCGARRAARPVPRRRRPCPRPIRRFARRWRPAVRASDRGWRSSRTRPAA